MQSNRHYAWANLLSVHYASLYRSGSVVAYLLAAGALGSRAVVVTGPMFGRLRALVY